MTLLWESYISKETINLLSNYEYSYFIGWDRGTDLFLGLFIISRNYSAISNLIDYIEKSTSVWMNY